MNCEHTGHIRAYVVMGVPAFACQRCKETFGLEPYDGIITPIRAWWSLPAAWASWFVLPFTKTEDWLELAGADGVLLGLFMRTFYAGVLLFTAWKVLEVLGVR